MRLIFRLLLVLAVFGFKYDLSAQKNYDKAWTALDNGDVPSAINLFEKALKDKETKPSAQLCLALLNSLNFQEEKASKYMMDYHREVKDPYPAIYALWEYEGVAGSNGKKSDYQRKLLEQILADPRNKGKLDAAITYVKSADKLLSMEVDSSFYYADQVKSLEKWSMTGPFDNVMNSGYNKDFGVVKGHTKGVEFNSKYGAKVTWFTPSEYSKDAYFFKNMFFTSANSLVYTQCYIDLEENKDLILKFGYSGSLKLWVNDSCIYTMPDHRVTEMDYYRIKLSLPKGTNRILVQLGDYEESNPSFTMRFTDADDNFLKFNEKPFAESYNKGVLAAQVLPYFAIKSLENKAKGTDPFYKLLLADAYMRSQENDRAEEIISDFLKDHPKNYFGLRLRILNYAASNDNTNQNKAFEEFSELYPNDRDILQSEISDAAEFKDKEKLKSLIQKYNRLYPDPLAKLEYNLEIAKLEEDNNRYIEVMDSMYMLFPDNYNAMKIKYGVTKNYYSNPVEANAMLERYIKGTYNHELFMTLADNYIAEGRQEDAKRLLEKNLKMVPYSYDSHNKLIGLYAKESQFIQAIQECKRVLSKNPSAYGNITDLAKLYGYIENKDSSIYYYKESLRYFPFSFEISQKVAELEGGLTIPNLLPDVDEDALIKAYEASEKSGIKRPYDIVYDSKNVVLYNTSARAVYRTYILRINDENGIEDRQKLTLSAGSNMGLYAKEFKTIKKDGSKLIAERNGAEVVFTNLEIGDYIMASYYEHQQTGGKSSIFYSTDFGLDAYYPIFKTEFNVFVEKGYEINTAEVNNAPKPTVDKVGNFTKYNWKLESPKPLKSESRVVPYNDAARWISIATKKEWKDIVEWYSDLSSEQAIADLTIKNIAKSLENSGATDLEKFKAIYEFVIANIRYSSIDFRQSSFVPQKASSIYHSRLGDCKDLSTLYASIAREMGLKVNLILINTSNNGEKAVVLPSLDFNHCIVRIYPTEGQPMYLELTDKDLPFGHLDYYHKNSAILEIPAQYDANANYQLEKLKLNAGYSNAVNRKAVVVVNPDLSISISKKSEKVGSLAGGFVSSYYYEDKERQLEKFKKAVSDDFESLVTLETLDLSKVKPRANKVQYSAKYKVEKDLLKLGSYRALKLPFSDDLTALNIFEEGEREKPFYFGKWETTDFYSEEIEVDLGDFTLLEIPEAAQYSFNGNEYKIEFSLLDSGKLKVSRSYKTNRVNILPEQFGDFKDFILKVNEVENTYLVLK